MSDSSAWQELRDRYFRELAEIRNYPQPYAWYRVWLLFVMNPWYRSELRAAARRVSQKSGVPQIDQQDIEHSAMAILARKLQNSLDLRTDRERLHEHFSGWLAALTRDDCREALRNLRRHHREEQLSGLPEEGPQASAERKERKLDVRQAIEQLDEPQRSLWFHRIEGYSIQGAADELGMNYMKAYRELNKGVEKLRRLLR